MSSSSEIVAPSRSDASGSASRTLAPPSRMRASAAARSASCRRCSASRARERAKEATPLATTAATRNAASATACPLSSIVKLPGWRQVEEVERDRAQDAREQAEPEAPQRRHEQHGEQIGDARDSAP